MSGLSKIVLHKNNSVTDVDKSDFDLKKAYYLSGPMSGYVNYNFKQFEKNCLVLRAAGILLRSPHENPMPADSDNMSSVKLWETMMDLAFKQMKTCDGIILMKGWPASKGAKLELMRALNLKWPVYYYNDNYVLVDMNDDYTRNG